MLTLKKRLSFGFYGFAAVVLALLLFFELLEAWILPIGTKLIVIAVFFIALVAGSICRVSYLEIQEEKHRTVKTTVLVLFAVYVFYLVWLLFLDSSFGRTALGSQNYSEELALYIQFRTNFVPFRTIAFYLGNFFNPDIAGLESTESMLLAQQLQKDALVNLVGNMVAFAPMGLFLPLLFERFKKFLVFAAAMLGILILIEALQIFTFSGSCDVDDIILNFAGALIVFSILKIKFVNRLFDRILFLHNGDAPIPSNP